MQERERNRTDPDQKMRKKEIALAREAERKRVGERELQPGCDRRTRAWRRRQGGGEEEEAGLISSECCETPAFEHLPT